jgi:predicted transglutaminase-like cysteine proteinase
MLAGILRAIAVLVLISTSAYCSEEAPNFLKVYGKTSPPVGYVQFCARGEAECKSSGGVEERLVLSPDNWQMLNQVNVYVNERIAPASDMDLYQVSENWTYPTDSGDCEDYVLLKKRYLQNIGFPADELLITVLLDEKGEGHAVLSVVSDEGDYILDNRRDEIRRWDHTQYRFLKRQSQTDPKQWVSLRNVTKQVVVGTK